MGCQSTYLFRLSSIDGTVGLAERVEVAPDAETRTLVHSSASVPIRADWLDEAPAAATKPDVGGADEVRCSLGTEWTSMICTCNMLSTSALGR